MASKPPPSACISPSRPEAVASTVIAGLAQGLGEVVLGVVVVLDHQDPPRHRLAPPARGRPARGVGAGLRVARPSQAERAGVPGPPYPGVRAGGGAYASLTPTKIFAPRRSICIRTASALAACSAFSTSPGRLDLGVADREDHVADLEPGIGREALAVERGDYDTVHVLVQPELLARGRGDRREGGAEPVGGRRPCRARRRSRPRPSGSLVELAELELDGLVLALAQHLDLDRLVRLGGGDELRQLAARGDRACRRRRGSRRRPRGCRRTGCPGPCRRRARRSGRRGRWRWRSRGSRSGSARRASRARPSRRP